MDVTDDTTLDDEYEMTWLDSLTEEQRELAAIHHLDQLEAVTPYVSRPNAWEED